MGMGLQVPSGEQLVNMTSTESLRNAEYTEHQVEDGGANRTPGSGLYNMCPR